MSVVSRIINVRASHLLFAEIGVLFLLQAILIIAWQATSPSVAHFQNQDNLRLLECLEAFARRTHSHSLSNHNPCNSHFYRLPRETST